MINDELISPLEQIRQTRGSIRYKDKDGTIYHTYSVYERGLDMFITAYHYLDIVPKGRNESDLSYTMEWLKRHDEYDN